MKGQNPMPYSDHLRVTMSGPIGDLDGSVERWSCRLNMSDPAPATSASSTYLEDIVADCKAWVSAESAVWQGAGLDQVKVAYIGPLGTYRKDAFVSDFPPVRFTGAGNIPKFPYQVACAVSLETGQRGGSKRGRIYLPVPIVSMEGDGQFTLLDATGIRDRFGVFVNNLNNGPGVTAPEPRVTIASVKGFNTDVTSVRVGRVLDTVRRRRRSLPEAYTASVAVTA